LEREDLLLAFDNFSSFSCPNCEAIGSPLVLKVQTQHSNRIRAQLVLNLKKEAGSISWMESEGLNRSEFALSLLYLRLHLHKGLLNSHCYKHNGYGIIAIDFVNGDPYLEMHTCYLAGFDAGEIMEVIKYIENSLVGGKTQTKVAKGNNFTINIVKNDDIRITRPEEGYHSPALIDSAFAAVRKKLKGQDTCGYDKKTNGIATINVEFFTIEPYEVCSIISQGFDLFELQEAIEEVYHGIPPERK
jgi:hypothetical protein